MHKNTLRIIIITLVAGVLSAARSDIFLLNDPSLPASADGFNLTFDTSTNLEWLDIDLSVGRTFADLTGLDGSDEFAPGGDFEGFRYATHEQLTGAFNGPQLDSLYKSLDISPFSFSYIAGYAKARLLLSTVGCFAECNAYGYANGILLADDGITEAAASMQAFRSQNSDFGQSHPHGAVIPRAPNDVYPVQIGNWLIRDAIPSDADNDTIPDSQDNCTNIANTDQIDTNGDGFGNRCDPDLNNDNVVNFGDVALWVPFFNTANNGDEDFTGDGLANFADFAVFPLFFLAPPGPSGIAP